MVAMLITMVGLVGLLQAVNLAMEHNLRNLLRDEAVLTGEKVMAYQKVRPFDQISTNPLGANPLKKNHPPPFNSRLRSGSVRYTVEPTSYSLSTAKELIVPVKWTYKGVEYTHEVRSIRSE